MIISEKQIIELIGLADGYRQVLLYLKNLHSGKSDFEIDIMTKDIKTLLEDIKNQQSEELKVIE